MAIKLKPKAGKATITKTTLSKQTVVSEDSHEEEVPVTSTEAVLETAPPCEVGVEMSYTHNLGNYQSARMQVSLKVPCATEEIDSVYEYSKEWVNAKLEGLVAELQAE